MDEITNNISQQASPGEMNNISLLLELGDRASIDNFFEKAATHYESALLLLDKDQPQDFEKTRACLNKLISTCAALQQSERKSVLEEHLKTIECVQNIETLKRTAEFYAERNQPGPAASTYLKALEVARTMRPINAPLLHQLNKNYNEQRELGGITEDAVESDESARARTLKSRNSFAAAPETRRTIGISNSIGGLVKSPALSLLITGLFFFSIEQALLTAHSARGLSQNDPVLTSKTMVGQILESCDGNERIQFSKENCTLMFADSKSLEQQPAGNAVNIYQFVNGINEIPNLFKGFLQTKQYWYRWIQDGLIAPDGVALYSLQSPEIEIVNKMWFYSSCIGQQYANRKSYPSSLDKCKREYRDFYYRNPFTKKMDCPEIVSQGPTSAGIDVISRQAHERVWRPGAILFLRLDNKHFIIQGFDRNGKPLASSNAQKYFAIELQDGHCITQHYDLDQTKEEPSDTTSGDTQQTGNILVYEDPDLEFFVQSLRRLPQLILWSIFTLASVFLLSGDKLKLNKRAKRLGKVTTIVSAVLLIAFYLIAII